jgi:hypothetical protein
LLPDSGAIHISRRDCVRRSPSRRKNRIYHAGVPSFPALRRAVHREEVRPTSAYENVRKLPRQAPTIGDVLYWRRSIDSPCRTPLDSQREKGRTRLNTTQFNGISRASRAPLDWAVAVCHRLLFFLRLVRRHFFSHYEIRFQCMHAWFPLLLLAGYAAAPPPATSRRRACVLRDRLCAQSWIVFSAFT